MSDDSESFETRSSGDLWSEICSDLPEPPEQESTDEHFTDSFQPHCPVSNQSILTSSSNLTSSSQWEPMADSAVYIAGLGMGIRALTAANSLYLKNKNCDLQESVLYCRESFEED